MKTKKLILVIFLTFIGAIGAYAQKTNVRMQETQARLLDVTSNAYVNRKDASKTNGRSPENKPNRR